MNSEEITKLKEHYVKDLQKPDIDKFERAVIIRSLLEDKGWSIRQMASEYNIPRSTIEDWLLYEKISETEYNRLVAAGEKPKNIYKALRKEKRVVAPVLSVDMQLEEFRRKIRSFKKAELSVKTPNLIDELVNELNAWNSEILRKNKRA